VRRTAIIATSIGCLLAIPSYAAREGSITGDLSPGVRASFKHRIVIEEETWPSALMETREGRAALALEEAGGFRLHVRVRENPDDYLLCVLYLDDNGLLVLDSGSRFVLHYGDREVESTEILLTDSIQEREVWSAAEQTIVLTSHSGRYARVRSGGYLTLVRFPAGSLPKGGEWVPDSFDLMRGGERYADAPRQSPPGARADPDDAPGGARRGS
jgi:hypothetical protein